MAARAPSLHADAAVASSKPQPSLGLAACTAIVIGNMVGSGFYLSPSAGAPYGLLGIMFWLGSGAGAVGACAKLVTFAGIALVGLAALHLGGLSEFNPSGKSLLDSSAALAPLTMFAYLGLESATVPAGDVRDPSRTIPRATILGIVIAALLYVLGTTVVMGVVPRDQLVTSVAPRP